MDRSPSEEQALYERYQRESPAGDTLEGKLNSEATFTRLADQCHVQAARVCGNQLSADELDQKLRIAKDALHDLQQTGQLEYHI